MKKSAVYVVIFLIVLLAAVIISFVRLSGDKNPEPTEPAVTTGQPAEPDESPVQTPEESNAPEDSPEPTAEITDTPEPTPSESVPPVTQPPAQQTQLGAGSFRSDTGTNLNLVVSWTAYSAGNGKARLEISIGAESYSLFTSALPGSITLTVDGASYTLGSPDIAYDGDGLTVTELASKTVEIELDSTGKNEPGITVLWNYRGSYGGTELENLLAIGSAAIG